MTAHLTPTIKAAYRDLLQRHATRPRPARLGSVALAVRGGVKCWVVRRRAGASVKETYLGLDTPEIRAEAEALAAELAALKEWKSGSAKIGGKLKSAGSLAPHNTAGRVLAAAAEAGFFDRGGLLVGTHAFRTYPLMLGRRPDPNETYTQDIDLLAPPGINLIEPEDGSLLTAIEKRGLPLTPEDNAGADAQRWIVDDTAGLQVLTSQDQQGSDTSYLDGIGMAARALPYIDFLLAKPVVAIALYREGIEVSAPAPERYALHKLIVSQLRDRHDSIRRQKDLQQAWWLLTVMIQERPEALQVAWQNMTSRGTQWRKLANAALGQFHESNRVVGFLNKAL